MLQLRHFYWNRHVVRIDRVSERVGVPTDDLYLMNRETYPDTLTILINEDDRMNTARQIDNTKTLFERTGIRFNDMALKSLKRHCPNLAEFDLDQLTPTGPNETVTEQDVLSVFSANKAVPKEQFVPNESFKDLESENLSEPDEHRLFAQLRKCDTKQLDRFVSREHDALQQAYQRMVNSAFWVAMVLNAPQGDMKYLPRQEEVEAAAGWIVEGIDFYCYDGQATRDRDPGRKSLSSKQYELVSGNADTFMERLEHVNDLRAVGFTVETSFEDEYNAVKADRLDRMRQRELDDQRAMDNRMAARATAREEVKQKLAGIL